LKIIAQTVVEMQVRIIALYEDTLEPGSTLKASRGMSWYIEFENQRILFDTGMCGKILLYNMNKLNLHPNDINKIVLSHAHIDHTGGLLEFLKCRTASNTLPIIAHPDVVEKKRAARLFDIGLPKISHDLGKQVSFLLDDRPYAINPYLCTTGEITERLDKDGTGWVMQHCVNGKWEKDPILDDLSLVLETPKGLILICGCCHAGLLNTLAHVKETFGKDVIQVLGGTHMRSFPKEEMEYIAKVLEHTYGLPKLCLGHCTGRKQTKWLMDKFGSDIVEPIHVGSEFQYVTRATITNIARPIK
jgi:7,8-dihydropterin-6-yl-methyl-4-(beta-D-ribofuranosyl)aminobenzene 5'-phosphate synthase